MQYKRMSLDGNSLRKLTCCFSALLLLLVLCFLPRPGLAAESEVIKSFASFVDVQSDGTLLVEERITVTALGDSIKRGIYRDFPLRYTGPGGYGGDVPFKVLSVSLDGKELSPDDVEYLDGAIRIFMRGAEELQHGEHSFVLNYATSQHVRQFEDTDELNWNVTGAYWAFPIEQVSCLIRLPEGASISDTIGWLGESGSKDSPLSIEQTAPGEVLFLGTLPVQPGEDFTVAVAFPKGVVMEEEPEPRLLDKIFALNSELWFKLMLIVLSISYYGVTWFLWGRDPKSGTIVPLFHAPTPEGAKLPLSSAAVPFVLNCKKLTNEGFASLFLSLALRGLCRVQKSAKGFVVQPLARDKATEQAEKLLSEEERAAYYTLQKELGSKSRQGQLGQIELNSDSSPAIHAVYEAVLAKLEEQYSSLWRPNGWIMCVGVLFWLPLCFTLGLGTANDMEVTAMAGFMLGVLLLCLTSQAALWLRALLQRKKLLVAIFLVLGFLLWLSFDSLNDFFEDLRSLFSISLDSDDALLLALFVPPVLFQRLMKAPSPACRALMDRIEGFQMYINTAEKDRIVALNGPEETPVLFQEILPYAVALGLAETWCSRFADQVAAGLIVNNNVPLDGWNRREIKTFVNAFSQSAAAASGTGRSSESAFSRSGGGGGAGSGSGGGGGGGC